MGSELGDKDENGLDKMEIQKQQQPPGCFGTRHLQIFLCFLGMIFGYGLRVIISIAIVAMTNKDINPEFTTYNWSTSDQGLIKSAFFWGYTAAQIPSGYIAGAWSAQKLLCLGIFVSSLSTMIVPLLIGTGGWPIFCVLRTIAGLSQACLLPAVQTLLSRWAPPSERARLGTFAYAGAQVGTVITMPISGWLASSQFGWPSIFYVFGALGVAWAVLFLILGSDQPAHHSSISPVERLYIVESLGKSRSNAKLKTPWLSIMTSIPMWALIIAHCAQNWGFWTLLSEIPFFMSKAIGFDINSNGLLSALPYLLMWLLSFPASWLSDYALRRGVPRGYIRKSSNTIAHWGPGFTLIALTFVDAQNSTLAVTLLVIAVGLNAGSLCGFQINHIDLSPNFAGTMMSITNCIASVIAIVAPIVNAEIVSDQTNVDQWHIVFYISAGIYFLGNLVFVVFGSGEVQWWNEPGPPLSALKADRSNKRSYNISTISAIYEHSDDATTTAYQKSA
ncbi:putative inorganic phosphate cotransporter [Copidosoma floridanum]|uniref:putative inorganic phosphate cotransporter n=1 Tax=Copidosoma floridanum TaxID=29053 RepID=UPI0006C9476A|nr:putative inorganic phosphate cotransporter [Copidosoma floridanum]